MNQYNKKVLYYLIYKDYFYSSLYEYKGFIIEYWEQSFSTNYSVVWYHEFVGFKNRERVTSESKQHRRYTDCTNAIKNIIKHGK